MPKFASRGRLASWRIGLAVACVVVAPLLATQAPQRDQAGAPPRFATPVPRAPLFFREGWRQVGAFDERSGFDPAFPVSQAAVTTAGLELHVYDPAANRIPDFAKNPPRGSAARDWIGSSCVILSGYNQDPPPAKVVHGEPSDPPNLWTGVCPAVAVTLRDKNRYVDLTGFAKIRWVTRVSGYHVVRPVAKLADGTWLVGDHTDGEDRPGAGSGASTDFIETEFSLAPVRWLKLDPVRMVTVGTWVEKPDLSRVDEVGFADLMAGSGHGWGGFVNVGRIEVYGAPVRR